MPPEQILALEPQHPYPATQQAPKRGPPAIVCGSCEEEVLRPPRRGREGRDIAMEDHDEPRGNAGAGRGRALAADPVDLAVVTVELVEHTSQREVLCDACVRAAHRLGAHPGEGCMLGEVIKHLALALRDWSCHRPTLLIASHKFFKSSGAIASAPNCRYARHRYSTSR